MKSKKTKTVTQKRKTKRKSLGHGLLLFHDPIFMHHMLACVYRSLELTLPGATGKIDAEFMEGLITPEGTGEREGGQE